MAKNVNIETIQFKLQGFGKLKSVNETFNKVNKSLGFTKTQINETIKSITRFDQRNKGANNTATRSVNTYNQQIAALRELQNSVAIGGKAYKAFGAEADRLRAQLEALTATQQKQGGLFRGIRQGAKAGGGTALTASVGRFLPAGAQIGGTAGFLKTGTIGGALAGAGVGLAVDAVAGAASFAADSAEYAAGIQKLQIALKGVTKDSDDFRYGLDVIAKTSKRLNVPIAASTKQFTTLSASVLGAGGTIQDAELVFTGVSNAIKATGGSADDVQSAIRAMSQIFGKGKVSAEELQGQLGERLAGAVVKFAEANGSSLAKLQKDLRDGTVGLDQVIKFAQKLNIDFADTANKVANSSADAGARFKTTMDRLKLAVGTILQPIGAEFQRVFTDIVGFITDVIEKFNEFMGIGTENAIAKQTKLIAKLEKQIDNTSASSKKSLKSLNQQLKNAKDTLAELNALGKDDPPSKDKPPKGLPPLGEGDSSPLKSFAKSAFDIAKQTEEMFVKAFKGMEDALVKFVETGKINFKDLARSIISDLTRMFIRYAIVKPLFKAIFPKIDISNAKGNVFDKGDLVPSAMGNVFAKNKIVPYAYGGIVNKPTLFPMANGTGLMGEAGPEAIMPLKRGKDGKLGVQSAGGVGNVVVNVDASGSNVTGDEQQSAALGKALGAAVQEELIKQKRPGGLLA